MTAPQRPGFAWCVLPRATLGGLVASLWLASALGVVAAAPQDSVPAAAAHERVIEGVPQYRLFFSSHATAGVCVLGFWKLKEETTPEAVLIATVGGHMRACGCGGVPVVWDVAKGIRDWCERHGKPFGAVDKPVLSDKPEERMSFDECTREIDAGRPTVVTYSLEAGARKDRDTALRSQTRVSLVGVGYRRGETEGWIIAQVPPGVEQLAEYRQLQALESVQPLQATPLRVVIPWSPEHSNAIITCIRPQMPATP